MTRSRYWTVGLAVVGLVVIAATFRDYGITFDEGAQARYGEAVVEYFRSGSDEWRRPGHLAAQGPLLRYYGPLFELVAALVYAPVPGSKYDVRHFLVALVGLGCVLALTRYGKLLGLPAVSVYAPLALLMMPRFYGHAFNNSKDVPFAALFAWTVYALCRFVSSGGSRRWLLLCGLALGGTLAVRPGGIPLLLGLFAGALGWSVYARADAGRLALRALAAWAVAWLVMVAAWPWAHQSPLLNPLRAVGVALAHPTAIPVLFEGRVWASTRLPGHYLLQYLLITTPPLTLVLSGLGAWRALRALRADPRSPVSLALLLVGAWLLVPLGLPLLRRPNVYDGVRHLLFVFPALALLAGLGATAILEAVGEARRRLVAVALAIALALPVASLVRLHPYQTTYFNVFVGGLAGAGGRYETDYWFASYKEASEWINARAAARPDREFRVLVAANELSRECAAWYLAENVSVSTLFPRRPRPGAIPEEYDYYVASTRYGFDRSFPASPIVHRVGRDGVTFTVIRGRAGEVAPGP